ncbi:MAG TPA: DUF1003 domain-containing protein [Candidatus Saccharimonadales bacterium]|nr:DUF1003 domain-containing protein [Candidatus Saccharimonadales bacterium]
MATSAQTAPQHTRHKPQNVNQQHEASLSFQDRLALLITSAVGTMYAVYFFVVMLAGWMLWQGAISHHPFDPYPFAFLLFIGNIVQLLLMPLIMVGQNIQGRHAELRSDEEYKTTLSSFHDIEDIMRHLEAQDQQLMQQSKMIEQLLQKR